MKIIDFKQEIEKVIRETVPGVYNINTNVYNNEESFCFEVDLIYEDPSCILTNKKVSVALIDVILDKDLCYRVSNYLIVSSSGSEELDLPEFLKTMKSKLEHERAQIIFNSIIGK